MIALRISHPQVEGVLQSSKQLKFQVLLDDIEMEALLLALKPIHLCVVSEPTALDDALVSAEEFLSHYQRYVNALKQGSIADEKSLRRYFSSAWTSDLGAVYAMPVSSNQYLVKALKPLIQLQAHHFFYSQLDQQFHPMVLSKESITWGVQFSYPQLYQDPKNGEIAKVGKGQDFPNTLLFNALTKWLRDHTMPTPFMVNGGRINASFRLGKACLNWIGTHPQLAQKGIEVFSLSGSNRPQRSNHN